MTVIYKICLQIIYTQDLALNNLQRLIYHMTKYYLLNVSKFYNWKDVGINLHVGWAVTNKIIMRNFYILNKWKRAGLPLTFLLLHLSVFLFPVWIDIKLVHKVNPIADILSNLFSYMLGLDEITDSVGFFNTFRLL